jgi:hypothetical protein
MRPMPVIFKYIVRQAGVAFVAGLVATAVSPLSGQGLDEAFGLAVGLRPVRPGEAVFDAVPLASSRKGMGVVAGAVIGEHLGDLDAVEGIKGEGLLQSGDGAGDLFVGMDAGEAQAAMIVNGDVQRLDTGAFAAVGPVAGATNAGTHEAAEFLDVQVDQFTRLLALVADGRWSLGFEELQAVKSVSTQDPADGGFGDWHEHQDMRVGLPLPAQRDDLRFEFIGGFSRLVDRHAGTVAESFPQPLLLGSFGPLAGGFLTDSPGGCCRPGSLSFTSHLSDHLCSTQRRKLGISVHVVRVVWLSVCCSSTHTLTPPNHADNLL